MYTVLLDKFVRKLDNRLNKLGKIGQSVRMENVSWGANKQVPAACVMRKPILEDYLFYKELRQVLTAERVDEILADEAVRSLFLCQQPSSLARACSMAAELSLRTPKRKRTAPVLRRL